jgi:hypothetical protein
VDTALTRLDDSAAPRRQAFYDVAEFRRRFDYELPWKRRTSPRIRTGWVKAGRATEQALEADMVHRQAKARYRLGLFDICPGVERTQRTAPV